MLKSDRLEHRRLRAPVEDGGTLIEPGLADVDSLVEENIAAREGDCELLGMPLAQLAGQAHAELAVAALRYTRQYRDVAAAPWAAGTRLALAGHQPELFHPGVWFKNFVLARIGCRSGALAVNLIIDSDAIKSANLRMPTGTLEHPLAEWIPFDAAGEPIPYEERVIQDRACLESFAQRAIEKIRPFVAHPLLESFWPLVVERSREERNLGLCLAQARHLQEARFGATTLELPQSQVCTLPSFHVFTGHLLAHLPRLWEAYNSAVAEYRQVNHLRSRSHPVPDLAANEQWLEAPYWIWTRDNPARRRLFVRPRGDELLLTDRGKLEVVLPLTADSTAAQAVAALDELTRSGVKLRTRARSRPCLLGWCWGTCFYTASAEPNTIR